MTSWARIERDLTAVLEGLSEGADRSLATVMAAAPADRRELLDRLMRARLPAACVCLTGRSGRGPETDRPGPAEFAVLLAAGSFRSEEDARIGPARDRGLWRLSEQAARALEEAEVDGAGRPVLLEERMFGRGEGCLVWEQRYRLHLPADPAVPTFGGVALAGPESRMLVRIGPSQRPASVFAFPGIDGVFERRPGLGERSIVWEGPLRAADDQALNALEAGIEAELRRAVPAAMVDPWGRTHPDCVLRSFERRGPRYRDPVTGRPRQNAVLTFAQLAW